MASWPEWLDVKTYWVFKCKRQQDKKDHVSIYLYIILCLKVVGTILQIERIEPFKEWMIQSKCDVCSISYGCCQFPWKWKIKRSSNNLYFHTHAHIKPLNFPYPQDPYVDHCQQSSSSMIHLISSLSNLHDVYWSGLHIWEKGWTK